jgi:cytoskeletal protein CcmA (bactofilin family)
MRLHVVASAGDPMEITLPNGTAQVLLALLLAVSVLPGVAAAESRSGGSIVVERGETVDGNLEAFGGNVVVRGTVTGDVSAFAGNVRIEGRVDGDVEAAAGSVVVAPNASVGGDLRASAGTVRIAGAIDGSVEAAAETVTLASTGTIGSDFQAGAETLRLASGSSVGGDVRYGGQLEREDGAQVGGSVERDSDLVVEGPLVGGVPQVPPWVGSVYGFLVNAALGALLLVAFPAFSRAVSTRASDSPLRSAGVGLVALLGVPLALVAVAITIIGIPLSIIGALLFALSLWIGAVYGRIAVGDWLVARAGTSNRWLGLLVGLVVVAVGVRIPLVGGLVELLVLLLGFGALAVTLSRGYRNRDREVSDAESDEAGDDGRTQPA